MFIIHSSTSKGKESDDDDDDSTLDVDAALGESVSVSGMYMENLFTPDADLTGITDERMKSAKINPLGIDVRTTKNGSMERGRFLDYSNHFSSQLPSDQGKNQLPAFLLLDGHNSRWDIAALAIMINNNTFTFYLASHTSIWSQPNDAGPNKKMHGEIETANSEVNKVVDTASVAYLNGIIFTAITNFIESEHRMLALTGSNNNTDGWCGTGLHPVYPEDSQLWSSAIDTLGLDVVGERAVSYEPAVREDAKDTDITDAERQKLLTDFGADDCFFKHPFAAAFLHGNSILRKWREAGDLAVPPAEVEGLSEEEIVALKLICFKNPADGIKKSKAVSKSERTKQVTMNILATIGPHQAVKVTQHPDGDGSNDADDDAAGTDGTAIRTGTCDSTDTEKWTVFTSKGQEEVTKAELLDPKKYHVHPPRGGSLTSAEKRAETARRQRNHAHEKRRQEQEAKKLCFGERNRMIDGWHAEINRLIAEGKPMDRTTFDKMSGEMANKYSGEYLLRNNLTGEDETVRVSVHNDQAAVFHTGVIDTLKSVVTTVKKQKGGTKRKSRDFDGANSSEGRRNVVSM